MPGEEAMGKQTEEEKPALRIVMPVVHTSPLATPGSADAGGLNVTVTKVAGALAAHGHRVDIVTRHFAPNMPYVEEVSPGIRVFYLPAGPACMVAKSAAESLIAPFTREFQNWWENYGEGVNIIHAHHWFAGVAAAPVARRAGVPLVASYHSVAAPEGAGLELGEPAESPGRAAGEAEIARTADLIVAVSQAEAQMITDHYGQPRGPVKVVHPGVDTKLFHPATGTEIPAQVIQVTEGRPYVFFAARLQPLKAPELAIRALAEIPVASRPLLVLAGEASSDFAGYEQDLQDLAAAVGVAGDTRMISPLSRQNLAIMLGHAKLLISPSYSETFGIINLEASASGIPVVAWRSSGIPESVRDGVTGTLCRTREPAEWAQAVVRYLEDPELWAQHAAGGRQFALAHTWDKVAREYIAAYESVVS
ncbi:glycosyltransferase [Actinobaculum suis]|uniref:glycosyltransferase n=2 Tax=Actinobaculum suis TaxID=1657 RepID=UPI0021002E95|nr:glycosyltransferase [Actinobaculum suis]